MQLTFKSEEHRTAFASRYTCNKWIADFLGMDTWECQIEDEEDRHSAIAVLDGFGDQIEGIFETPDGDKHNDFAWIFFNERQYFDIDY